MIAGEERMWEGWLRRKRRGPRGRDVSWERRRPFRLLPGEKRRTLSSGEAPDRVASARAEPKVQVAMSNQLACLTSPCLHGMFWF